MRVSELAKELGKSSKDVLDVLQKNNQDVATHSSNVSDAQIGIVKKAPVSYTHLDVYKRQDHAGAQRNVCQMDFL